MRETISRIENAEKIHLEKIENEKKIAEKKLEQENLKCQEKIKNLKKQNKTTYEKEIANFKLELEKEENNLKNLIYLKCLKFEENFKKNCNLAVSVVINEILNYE